MFGWFDGLGTSEEEFRERVHIAAVIRCFPGKDPKAGGDRVPDVDEIARCGVHLDREITILAPKLVIAVGTLAASVILSRRSGEAAERGEGPGAEKDGGPSLRSAASPLRQLRMTVGVLHRAERVGKEFDVVVLPHPSGRSTWLNKPENAKLLQQSLELIRTHPAFTAPRRRRRG
jgi:uracil-DNA glycosylase